MDTAGPFETARAAYYYVTLPEQSWKPEQTEDFLRGAYSRSLIDVVNIVSGNFDRPGGAMFTTPAVDLAGLPDEEVAITIAERQKDMSHKFPNIVVQNT
mgnify:CR=1 FL=1